MSFPRLSVRLTSASYVFAAGLLVQLVVVFRVADSPFLLPTHGDMAFYNDWARQILSGRAIEPLAFYGLPGYAYWLAAIYYLFGYNPFVPLLIQACAQAGTGALLYRISVRLFANSEVNPERGRIIGLVAAVGWAFFEPAQAYAAILMPTALSVFVFWLISWQIVKRDALPRLAWFGLFGCLIGLCATGVATILFLLPLLVIASFGKWRVAVNPRQFWETRLFRVFLLIVGIAIGTAPCWIHNYFYTRDPVLLSAHSGVNFWIGNNPAANGYPTFPPGLHAGQKSMLQDSITEAERVAGHPLKRSEVSAYWSSQAKNYIQHHFGQWLRLLGTKVGNFWNAFQYDDLSVITILREERVILPGISFGLVAALALAGLSFAIADTAAALWIGGAIALHLCALLPVFVTERYRLTAVPGLLIFAAYGLWWFARSCRQLRLKPIVIYLTVLIAAVLLVSQPRSNPSLWALDPYNSGIAALDLGRYELAKKKLDLAYSYVPDNAELNFALGNLYFARGDASRAKVYYRNAITLDPRHGRAFNNLGVLALAEERWQMAEYFFGQALQENSHDGTTHFYMAKTFLGAGNQEAARAELNTAIALEPDQRSFIELRDEITRSHDPR